MSYKSNKPVKKTLTNRDKSNRRVAINSEELLRKITPTMTLVSFMLLLATFMFEKNLNSLVFTYPLYCILFSLLFIVFGLYIGMFKSAVQFSEKIEKWLNHISIVLYFLGIFGFIVAISLLIKSVQ